MTPPASRTPTSSPAPAAPAAPVKPPEHDRPNESAAFNAPVTRALEGSPEAEIDRQQQSEEPAFPIDADDLKTLSLFGLLLIGVFFTLYYARAVFFPILLAGILSLLLSPIVRGLNRIGVPNFLGAILVIVSGVTLIAAAMTQLLMPAAQWFQRAPENLRRIEERLDFVREPIARITAAGERLQQAAQVAPAAPAEGVRPPVEVQVGQPGYLDTLLTMTGTVVADSLVTLILLYFLLSSGDSFLRKAVEVMPRFQDKRKLVEIARSIQKGVSMYLLSVTAINCCLGLAIAAAMGLLGMPNPLLWGAMAAILNFIPYLGALVGVAVVTLVALVTYENVGFALLVPAVYFSLTSLEGNFVTPTVLGYRLDLNPVIIFVWLLFWGWLWGVAGALLAVPMLAAFKIFCDHLDALRPVGKFLVR